MRVEPIESKEMIRDIMEYFKATNERDFVMFCIGIYTGLRISDILRLRVNDVYCKNSLFLGVVMLCMVPISYFDPRKEMRGKFSVIMSCIMHLVISIWISYVQWSWKIMAIYIIEVIMIMGIIWTVKRNGRSGAGKL